MKATKPVRAVVTENKIPKSGGNTPTNVNATSSGNKPAKNGGNTLSSISSTVSSNKTQSNSETTLTSASSMSSSVKTPSNSGNTPAGMSNSTSNHKTPSETKKSNPLTKVSGTPTTDTPTRINGAAIRVGSDSVSKNIPTPSKAGGSVGNRIPNTSTTKVNGLHGNSVFKTPSPFTGSVKRRFTLDEVKDVGTPDYFNPVAFDTPSKSKHRYS